MANKNTEDDIVRERELFRYFQPLLDRDDNLKASQRQFLDSSVEEAIVTKAIESPDTTLTALAQLCACRLDASRAMVSVIGKETQHFIAEATRTVRLSDTTTSEDVNDGLWVGCTSVNKEGRLCEKTVELAPTDGKYPCFQVMDLSADERFNTLPFVTGPPNFRFYAGTCLTTRRGINIGSLFIVDDRVRPELTASQVDFLGTVAAIVMRNLELNQEAEERNRFLKMSGALNAFQLSRSVVENTNPTERTFTRNDPESRQQRASTGSIIRQGGSVTRSPGGSYSYRDTHPRPRRSSPDRSWSTTNAPYNEAEDPDPAPSHEETPRAQDQSANSTFVRAASLLRQSLDLQDTGGVVFLDSRISFRGREAEISLSPNAEDKQSVNSKDATSPLNDGFGHKPFSRKSNQASEVIGFSAKEFDLGFQANMKDVDSFNPISQITLQGLLQHYPRGKLWCLNDEGALSAWDEDIPLDDANISSRETTMMRHQRKQTEATLLSRCFPNVRQLLFAPLWDSSAGRWFSGCFCFSTSPRQIYSMEAELNFLSTFCNTVMAEASRVASMAAERQKGDFIGSISHELRSPLHGILASTEFLAETESDPFQNSLVDTITSCGRTLLDTVNHILDYSKINSYEKNWDTARKSRSQKSTMVIKSQAAVARPPDKEAPPLLNLYATVDVAAVAEEVVEGVYAGQIYQDISSTDIAFMSSETKSKISERGIASERRGLGETKRRASAKEVEVILDISRGDFTFTTQPGALRRIIMNLFGNSLKYTEKGVIVVSLTLTDLDDDDGGNLEDQVLEITIKDTGKGISSEYLRSNLFTPFSQEDTLATGVGLGLSIVKSIVNMLNGSIDIRSEVGEGTEVFVRIPLMRLPGAATTESTPSTVTSSGSLSTYMQGLQSDHCGEFAVLYGSHNERGASARSRERMRVLHNYVTQWFGLKAASASDPVDLIIVDEKDLPEVQATQLRRYPTVVLCGRSPLRLGSQSGKGQVIEYVSQPFGPYKLAKAVYTCLEKAKGDEELEADPTMTFPDESPVGSLDRVISGLGALHVGSQVSSHSSITERQCKSDQGEFPFPSGPPSPIALSSGSRRDGTIDRVGLMPDLVRRDSRRPKLTQRFTEPMIKNTFPTSTAISSAVTKSGEFATFTSPQATAEIAAPRLALKSENETEPLDPRKLTATSSDNTVRPPKLLLVDDNKINLRLLETFMKKRKYKLVDSAENGQLAVNAAEANPEGYDIIFMVSMPIMNGFEATQAIREIEVTRNAIGGSPGSKGPMGNRALIIALTGLASSRDQTEAFNSGVDLFLTKPVSFKEVGRILDNWETHGGGGNEAPVAETEIEEEKGSGWHKAL